MASKKKNSDVLFSSNRAVRVVEHEVAGVCGSSIEESFRQCYDVFQPTFNEIVSWGVDSVLAYENGEVVEKDLKRKINKLCKKYVKKGKLSKEQMVLLLKNAYGILITTTKSWRGFQSSIYGGCAKTSELRSLSVLDHDFSKTMAKWLDSKQLDELTDGNEDDKKSKGKLLLFVCIINTLHSVGFFNRFPFNVKKDEDGNGVLTNDECYVVLENILRILTSWIDCDKATRKNYRKEEIEIEKAVMRLDNDERKEMSAFFDFCRLEQEDGTIILKKFDTRIVSHLVHCVIPSFRKGQRHIKKPVFINHKGYSRKFSLHQSFYDYLYEHPQLWNDNEDIKKCMVVRNLWILDRIMLHEKHKPSACYPFMSDETIHRFNYYCGDNFVSYKLRFQGKNVEDTSALEYKNQTAQEVNFINGKKCDIVQIQIGKEVFPIHMLTKYYSKPGSKAKFHPTNYFQNLSVWENAKKEGEKKKKTSYLFEFDKRGKTFKAIVKEPSIVLRNGVFYMRINHTVNIDEQDPAMQAAFNVGLSACPSRKTNRQSISETSKVKKHLQSCKGETIRALGVDLGVSRPYAYSCAEWKVGSDESSIIESGICNISSNSLTEEYYQLRREVRVARAIVGITKAISKEEEGDDEIVFEQRQFEAVQKAQKRLAKEAKALKDKNQQAKKRAWVAFSKMGESEVLESIRRVILECDGDLKKVKTRTDWVGTMMLKYISLRFGELKHRRKMHLKEFGVVEGKLEGEFVWIQTAKALKAVKKSISELGCQDEEKPKIFFDKLNKYIKGCKDNLLKHIADGIVKKSIDLDCNIIVLERLEGSSLAIEKAKKENELLAMWSPKRIQKAIKNAAEWHGLMVATVSESCTSKVHYETGRFGYRSGRFLYYEDDNGDIQSVDADINAAKNIVRRFIVRHADLTQICVIDIMREKKAKEKKDKEKKAEKKPEEKKAEKEKDTPQQEEEDEVVLTNKRKEGFLTKHFGGVNAAKKYFSLNFSIETKYVYYHNGQWISDNQLKEIEDRIKTAVEA